MLDYLKNDFLEPLWSNEWTKRGVLAIVGVGAVYVGMKFKKRQENARLRAKWNSAGKDVVVLHQFWRGKFCPNMSPYCLKVESFLRLAGIKYVVDIQKPFGEKRALCPWITINGEDIEDSQHVVERLTEKFNIKIDDHLTPERKAILEAVRIMLEEQMFWILFMWRFYHTNCKTFEKTQVFPNWFLHHFFKSIIYKHSQKRGKAQGIARHTLDEQIAIARKQIVVLNTVLGDRQYYGGDEPCSVDGIIFGFLAQFMWNDTDSPFETLIKETYPALAKYTLRMKERIFPDWKKLLNPPQA